MNPFEELLQDFGKHLGVTLHAEKGKLCKLCINNILPIHLEWDETKSRLLLAAFIAELPAGKYRENILKESLKANHLFPRTGTFAFSGKNNKLAFFEYFPMGPLNGPKLLSLFDTFIQTADLWRMAIETGQMNLVAPKGSKIEPSSPFGLKK